MEADTGLPLAIGTAVSAKFKGAFCEATIKEIKYDVKVRVQFKNSSKLTLTLSSDFVRGELQPHNNVQARTSPSEAFQAAEILKVTDHSIYTVEFDDGDLQTVKRSGIRLKSVPFFHEKPYDRPVLANPESLVKDEKKRLKERASRQSKDGYSGSNEGDAESDQDARPKRGSKAAESSGSESEEEKTPAKRTKSASSATRKHAATQQEPQEKRSVGRPRKISPAKPEGRSKEPAPKPRENGVGEPAKKKLRRGISSGKTERSPKRRGSNDAPEHDENEALYLYRIGEKVLGIAYYDGKVYPCKILKRELRNPGRRQSSSVVLVPHYNVNYRGWAHQFDEWLPEQQIMGKCDSDYELSSAESEPDSDADRARKKTGVAGITPGTASARKKLHTKSRVVIEASSSDDEEESAPALKYKGRDRVSAEPNESKRALSRTVTDSPDTLGFAPAEHVPHVLEALPPPPLPVEEATASPPSPVAVEMVDESPIEAAEETRDVTPQPGADADELAAEEREPVDDFIGVGAVTNEMAELAEQSELAAQEAGQLLRQPSSPGRAVAADLDLPTSSVDMLQSEPVPKSSAMDIDGMESDIAAFVATEEAVPVSEVATDQPERPEVPVDEAAEAVVESKEAVTPDQSAEADGASSQSEDETLLQLVTDNADDNEQATPLPVRSDTPAASLTPAPAPKPEPAPSPAPVPAFVEYSDGVKTRRRVQSREPERSPADALPAEPSPKPTRGRGRPPKTPTEAASAPTSVKKELGRKTGRAAKANGTKAQPQIPAGKPIKKGSTPARGRGRGRDRTTPRGAVEKPKPRKPVSPVAVADAQPSDGEESEKEPWDLEDEVLDSGTSAPPAPPAKPDVKRKTSGGIQTLSKRRDAQRQAREAAAAAKQTKPSPNMRENEPLPVQPLAPGMAPGAPLPQQHHEGANPLAARWRSDGSIASRHSAHDPYGNHPPAQQRRRAYTDDDIGQEEDRRSSQSSFYTVDAILHEENTPSPALPRQPLFPPAISSPHSDANKVQQYPSFAKPVGSNQPRSIQPLAPGMPPARNPKTEGYVQRVPAQMVQSQAMCAGHYGESAPQMAGTYSYQHAQPPAPQPVAHIQPAYPHARPSMPPQHHSTSQLQPYHPHQPQHHPPSQPRPVMMAPSQPHGPPRPYHMPSSQPLNPYQFTPHQPQQQQPRPNAPGYHPGPPSQPFYPPPPQPQHHPMAPPSYPPQQQPIHPSNPRPNASPNQAIRPYPPSPWQQPSQYEQPPPQSGPHAQPAQPHSMDGLELLSNEAHRLATMGPGASNRPRDSEEAEEPPGKKKRVPRKPKEPKPPKEKKTATKKSGKQSTTKAQPVAPAVQAHDGNQPGWGDAHASYPYVMGRPPGYHPHPQPYGHYAPSHPGHMQPAPGYGQPPHASSQPPHPDPGFGQGRHHPQAMHGAGFGQGHPQPGSARSPHHPPGFGPSNHHGPAHTPGYVHVQPRTHPAQQQDNASQHPPSPGYGQGNLRPGPAPSGQAPVLGQRESVPSPAGPTQQPPTPRYGHDARSPIGHEGSGADPPHNLQANTLPTLDSKVATAHQQVNESQAPSNESGAAPAGKPTNRLSLSQELSKPTSEPPIGDIKAMDKNHANLLEEALVVSQQHLEISGSCSSTAL